MKQTFKILREHVKVNKSTWFELVASTGRVARMAADPMNLKVPAARLDVKSQFYSQRVPESWNQIPQGIKQAETVKSFQNRYRDYRRMVATALAADGRRRI